jgi:large subunit ribosomal protein L10
MSKAVKQLELDALRADFKGVMDYVLLEPVKVDSATEYQFRKTLREKKVRVKLVKNSYAKKIFGELGVKAETSGGPTLVCWGADSIKTLANAVDEAVKATKKDPKAPEKMKVKGAVADGQAVTLELAKTLPTRLEAIGDVLSAILGPGSSLVSALIGPGTELAGILKAIEEKKPEGEPAAEATPAPAA